MATPNSVADRYKLVFFVPEAHLESCKAAVFAGGAGRYPGPGNYTEVCWHTMGTGQFRPGKTSTPFIGTPGELEVLPEARVEVLIIGVDNVKSAINGLKSAHPYEEVAYEVYRVEDL